MNKVPVLICLTVGLQVVGCRRDTSQRPIHDPVQERLSALYAKQDALYAGRYGRMDASGDIERGAPKLILYGLYRESDREWFAMLRKRFSVEAQYVAACEVSPSLTNYADAYDSRIREYIAERFGPSAYATSQDDAVRAFQRSSDRANQPAPAQRP